MDNQQFLNLVMRYLRARPAVTFGRPEYGLSAGYRLPGSLRLGEGQQQAQPAPVGALGAIPWMELLNTQVGALPLTLSTDGRLLRAESPLVEDEDQRLTINGRKSFRQPRADVGFTYGRGNPDNGLDVYGRRAVQGGRDWELGLQLRRKF